MDELSFKMPEKWCIRGSEELRKFQRDQLSDNADKYLNVDNNYYYTEDSNFLIWHERYGEIPQGYTEITFEQFKEYYNSLNTPKKESILEQLREKCFRLDFMPIFSGVKLMSLKIESSDGKVMHRLEKYRDFDKLCENALIILNLEE